MTIISIQRTKQMLVAKTDIIEVNEKSETKDDVQFYTTLQLRQPSVNYTIPTKTLTRKNAELWVAQRRRPNTIQVKKSTQKRQKSQQSSLHHSVCQRLQTSERMYSEPQTSLFQGTFPKNRYVNYLFDLNSHLQRMVFFEMLIEQQDMMFHKP